MKRPATSPRYLMRLHVAALFTLDQDGRLERVNDAGGAPAPRFFLGRTDEANEWWFRHDVNPDLVRDLEALCRLLPPGMGADDDLARAAPLVDRLSRDHHVRRTWAGPAFHFPADPGGGEGAVLVTPANAHVLRPYLESWTGDIAPGVPMAVSLDGGHAVSICASVRVTQRAHEAGVETHPDFCRRGHATRAVAAWARAVRAIERIPLYSTSWDNTPSRALARKLGLIPFGSDLHIT